MRATQAGKPRGPRTTSASGREASRGVGGLGFEGFKGLRVLRDQGFEDFKVVMLRVVRDARVVRVSGFKALAVSGSGSSLFHCFQPDHDKPVQERFFHSLSDAVSPEEAVPAIA